MPKYELELQRRYYINVHNDDTYKPIAQSDNDNELRDIAITTKVKSGKTFYEVLNLNELDNDDDIINVETLKESNH